MSSFDDLLKSREITKKKKTNFIRQDYKKIIRLEKEWRRPKGIHSKIRLAKGGHIRRIEVGYKSPKLVRGLHRSGLKIRLVNSFKDIKDIDKNKEGIIISRTVGLKKRIELIKKIIENGIIILNTKDPKEYLRKIEDSLRKKKEEREKSKQVKEKKGKEKKVKEKEEKKEELAEKIEKEEKDKEKKEKDKLLTKRI